VSPNIVSCTPQEQLKLTHDFVVRSLRRRLWKAFQEDDKETALRAYQATLAEFVQWLQEEEDYRIKRQAKLEKRAALTGGEVEKVSNPFDFPAKRIMLTN
jgi:hypothetical protein